MTPNDASYEIEFKAVEPRYIMINEDIYDALSRDERDVYLALRFEADYSKETSLIKRSINFIVEKSKVGRRKVFHCLNTLESKHFLIQRIEQQTTGFQNIYNISRTLNFFNPLNTRAPHALVNKNCTDLPVTSAPRARGSAPRALHIINSSLKDLDTIPDSDKSGITKFDSSKVKDYTKDARFMRFYDAYPKKVDPRDAWKAFKSIVGDDNQLLEDIIRDIEARKARHTQWQDKQFIKYPAVYLRKGEYLGEIINQQDEMKKKHTQESTAEGTGKIATGFMSLTPVQKELIQEYQHRMKNPALYAGCKPLSNSERCEAEEIIETLRQEQLKLKKNNNLKDLADEAKRRVGNIHRMEIGYPL